jgi:hypothetical protein
LKQGSPERADDGRNSLCKTSTGADQGGGAAPPYHLEEFLKMIMSVNAGNRGQIVADRRQAAII